MMIDQEIKYKIQKIILFILFLGILFFVFSRVTYLFREVSISRDNITGFEQESDLDVVCIGASTMIEYYQPLTAWKEYGFTSYAYATIYGQIDLYWRYIDKVLETHSPELFVVDLRMITAMEEKVNESGIRFWTDSLPILSLDRYASLNDYLDMHALEEGGNKASYYLDIAKYHTNSVALETPDNWNYINNKGNSLYKGYELSSEHHFIKEPVVNTEEVTELSTTQAEVLYQLLDYCKDRDINVLFVICPYMVLEDEQKIYNTVGDIVSSYGYNFVNANEHYADMGLDFSTDMKNINHTNSLGAEKYTKYLAGYIMDNYDIVPETDEKSYEQWQHSYDLFRIELSKQKDIIYQTVEEKYEAVEMAKELLETNDFQEWYSIAQNENFTTVICGNLEKCRLEQLELKEQQQIVNLQIDIDGRDRFLRIASGENMIYFEQGTEDIDYISGLGAIDGMGQIVCEVHVDGEVRMKLGEDEYDRIDDGIYCILIDNNYKKVIDSRILYVSDEGVIQMNSI